MPTETFLRKAKKLVPFLAIMAAGQTHGEIDNEKNSLGINLENFSQKAEIIKEHQEEDILDESFDSAKELREYLSKQTCFDRFMVDKLVEASILGDVKGWSVENEQVDLSVELAKQRVWQWLEFVSGQESSQIDLQDRVVQIRHKKKMVDAVFTVAEQQEYIEKWLKENQQELVATNSHGVVNYDRFIHDKDNEGHLGVVRIAQLANEFLPLGLVKMTSGYRSSHRQERIIKKLAKENGLLEEEIEELPKDEILKLLPPLRRLGVKVASPGSSKHEKGLAADLRVLQRYEMLSGSEIEGVMDQLVQEDLDLTKMIFEPNQGIMPVVHVEIDRRFIVEEDSPESDLSLIL